MEGVYLVSLTVYTLGGISRIGTVEVNVQNEQPSLQISVPESAIEDELVTFTIESLHDTSNDVDSMKFQWVLGDGRSFNSSSVTCSFPESGRYPVTLYIFDDQNYVDYDYKFIEIQNAPPEAIITSEHAILEGTIHVSEDEMITFNGSESSDTISDAMELDYYWIFGDNSAT